MMKNKKVSVLKAKTIIIEGLGRHYNNLETMILLDNKLKNGWPDPPTKNVAEM